MRGYTRVVVVLVRACVCREGVYVLRVCVCGEGVYVCVCFMHACITLK